MVITLLSRKVQDHSQIFYYQPGQVIVAYQQNPGKTFVLWELTSQVQY